MKQMSHMKCAGGLSALALVVLLSGVSAAQQGSAAPEPPAPAPISAPAKEAPGPTAPPAPAPVDGGPAETIVPVVSPVKQPDQTRARGGEQNSDAPAQPGPDAAAFGSLSEALSSARSARCRTAICWGDDNKWAIEPLAELPIGKTFSITKDSDVGNYINNHSYSASLAAGIRVWLFHDVVSLSMYLSTPLGGDDSVRVRGSSFEFPATKIKRPYPGVALGVLGDTVWIGLDHDQLRNGDSDTARDPSYPRNGVVDRAWTLTVAIATVTTIRNGLGLATAKNKTEPARVE